MNLSIKRQEWLRYPVSRRFCALFESPLNACYQDIEGLTERYSIIFTHQAELIKRGQPFKELMFGTNWVNVVTDEDTARARIQHPEKTRLVSFIGSLEHEKVGAYQLRREVAEYCMKNATDTVDCFGRGIRPVDDKREALAPYRFSIAMENAASDYYFSEKLVDCLLMDVVPIYYGCPGIGDLFDQRGILQFQSLTELRSILETLSLGQYQAMLPFARQNKERVIKNNWHSHLGIFTRIAEELPRDLYGAAEASGSTSLASSVLRKIWKRFW